MTTTPNPKTICPERLVSNEAQRDYNHAMDEGHRARVAGNETDFAKATRAAAAATAKMKPCVIDAPHQPPHRAADGTEWGHIKAKVEMVALPTPEVVSAWLREQGEVDVDVLAERIVDQFRQGFKR